MKKLTTVKLRAGMLEAVQRGTARSIAGVLAGTRWKIGGKTGTGQNPHGDDHAVFICFAPVDDPQIAIAVLVENGGHGGSTAAPIAHAGLVARLLPAAPLAKAATGVPAGGPLAVVPGGGAAVGSRSGVQPRLKSNLPVKPVLSTTNRFR